MTWDEYFLYSEGYRVRLEREWDQTRSIIACWSGKSPKQIMKLSIDGEDDREPIDQERAEKIIKAWR
jgi:hypothetical protein